MLAATGSRACAEQALQLSLRNVDSTVVSTRTDARSSRRRVQIMENNADRRIPPLLADGSTPDVSDAAIATSWSGRAVRRPGALAQFLL